MLVRPVRLVFPVGNHFVPPLALLQVTVPCVPSGGIQTIYIEQTRSGVYFTGSIQIMVGTLFTTPLECGTIFRNIAWAPLDHKNSRRKYCWDTMLTNFCRLKGLASWEVIATDADFWNSLLQEFLAFSLPNVK